MQVNMTSNMQKNDNLCAYRFTAIGKFFDFDPKEFQSTNMDLTFPHATVGELIKNNPNCQLCIVDEEIAFHVGFNEYLSH
jgi:hypothetical protein